MNPKYMQMAIAEAKKSTEPLRCGVVIVRGGEVLAKTFNSQRTDCNAAAHAEIKALEEAGAKLGNKNLDGADVYCTCEPCIMCLAALSFAKVDRVIYGASLSKVSPIKKNIGISADEFIQRLPKKIYIIPNYMEEECMSALYS